MASPRFGPGIPLAWSYYHFSCLYSKGGRMSFQLPLPLPLPKHLLLFSLGDWGSYSRDSCVTAQLVTGSAQPQLIGTLSAECR